MNILYKILNDFKTLTRFQIGLKYVFPYALILFLWGTFGFIYMNTLMTKDLVSVNGFVTNITFEKKKNGDNLLLKINNVDYRILNHGFDMKLIAEEINQNNFVDLFIRTSFQHYISLGKKNDIMQIKQRDKILISFDTMKNKYRNLSILTGIFSIVLIVVLVKYRNTI